MTKLVLSFLMLGNIAVIADDQDRNKMPLPTDINRDFEFGKEMVTDAEKFTVVMVPKDTNENPVNLGKNTLLLRVVSDYTGGHGHDSALETKVWEVVTEKELEGVASAPVNQHGKFKTDFEILNPGKYIIQIKMTLQKVDDYMAFEVDVK